jgi:hypothetical protein
MLTVNATECCGMAELSGISNFKGGEDFIKALLLDGGDTLDDLNNAPLVVMTAVTKLGAKPRKAVTYGPAIATYLTENGLGEVVASPLRVNPNSKNTLVAYLWTPNYKALDKHLKALLKGHEAKEVSSPHYRTLTVCSCGDNNCGLFELAL